MIDLPSDRPDPSGLVGLLFGTMADGSTRGHVKGVMQLEYPQTIAELKPDPTNPRKIEEAAADGLRESLTEFGDLGGIVYSLRTGQLVAGHQRVSQLARHYGHNLKINRPDERLDRGFIETPRGDLFTVRFVDWPEDRQRMANIAANNPAIAGQFTDDLSGMLNEIRDSNSEAFERLRMDQLVAENPESFVSGDAVLKPMDTRRPPSMTWVLVGIPTARWGEIAEDVAELADVEGIVLEMTSNDG